MTIATKEPIVTKAPWYSADSGLFRSISTAGPFTWALAIAIIGVIIGLISSGNQLFDWSYALVDAIFAFGCAMAISWGGVHAFGMALFYAAGGYTAAMLVPLQLPSGVTLLAGALAGGLFALIFSAATLKVPLTSFGMLSLVVAEAGNRLIYTIKPLGGENGLYGVARPNLFGWVLGGDLEFYFYCVALVVLVVLVGRWLYQSTTGRAIRASRDDVVRAEALGTNIGRTRVIAFTAGGITCGIAGVTYAQLQGVVDPSMGDFNTSTIGVMMVVLGGLGTFAGALLGGVIYRWLDLLVTPTPAPDLFIGIILILVVLGTPVVAGAITRARVRAVNRAAARTSDTTSKEEAK